MSTIGFYQPDVSPCIEPKKSIRETLDADKPCSIPLHRIHLVDAVEGDASVDVGANPLLLRPLAAHLWVGRKVNFDITVF